MFGRISVIILNTYCEAVRARLLHGLFGLAIATTAYAVIVGHYASHSAMRVVSDIGAASISLYAIVVAVVIGATSLYREVELKTVFPILARPIRRSEYLIGKYLGAVFTLAVFIVANAGVLFVALAVMAEAPPMEVVGFALGSILVALALALKLPRVRTYIPVLWAITLFAGAWWLAGESHVHRRVVTNAAALSLLEVAVVTAVATVFASFSTPFLSAVLTLGVFVVGRSADTLANLPPKVFGEEIPRLGAAAAEVVPNLMFYVPPRPLLAGEVPEVPFGPYLVQAAGFACLWSLGLLVFASFVFRRRDFL